MTINRRKLRRTIERMTLGGALAVGAAATGLMAADAAADQANGPDTGGTTSSKMISASGTIEKIDKKNRTVTLKGSGGATVDVAAPEDMTRFDELKVGDRVDVTYKESVALAVIPPGAPTPKAMTSSQRMAGGGASPGGSASRQTTTTVTIVSLDPERGSVTFKKANGQTSTMAIEDASVREQVSRLKPGDRVQVTYGQALAASITPHK